MILFRPKRFAQIAVTRCCALLRVSRALVYRKSAPRAREPALLPHVQRVLEEFPAYGYRRVAAQLVRSGVQATEKQVRSLMERHKLMLSRKRRKAKAPYPSGVKGANLTKGIEPAKPDQVWVADCTWIPVGKGHCVLSVVMDACSRRVLGWALSRSGGARLSLAALRLSLSLRRPPRGWIHHSDRGSEYTCREYRAAVAAAGGLCSFSGSGRPLENAKMESFFSTLKREEVRRNLYETLEEAEDSLCRFIDLTYNSRRLHSSLGNVPPEEFETMMDRLPAVSV